MAGVAVTALLAAAACGQSSTDTSSGENQHTIAGVSILMGDPYFVSMKCGAQDAAKTAGVKLMWDGSTSADVAPQKAILDSMKLKKPDAYIFTPFSQDAYLADVKQLMSDGAPVVLADATMAEHVYYQSIQSDNEEAGKLVADYIVDAVGSSGTVGIVAFGPGNPIDEARYNGLAERITSAAPGVKVLEPQYGKGSSSDSAKVVSGLIQGNPDLKVVFATNGPQATGAASAIKAAGKEGQVKLIAYAGEAAQVQALRQGAVDALLAQSPYLMGQKAVEIAVDYLDQHPNEGAVAPADNQFVYTPTMLITADNVDSAEAKPFLEATC
jgi:ribose transport system substrate-binding protein